MDFGGRGGCEFANQGWLDFTGRSLEQNLGKGWAESLHPDDMQRTMDTYQKSSSNRLPLELEYRARRHDGEYRWIYVRGMPRHDANGEFKGYIGSAIDLTERRYQEAALKRSEARYRNVVESQIGCVCRFLPDATLTFVNSAYCRFLGKPRLELLGASFLELLPPVARPAAREAIERAVSSAGHAAWECEVEHADGTRGWQSWVCHLIESASEEAREIQAIGHDITDRKRAEESGRQLAHAARFAVVGELTAMVAHEVNQPLCAILSNAEAAEILLRSERPPLDELRQILADIREDDLRADAAIRGIRSLVHRREFEPLPMDVAETIEHVAKLTAGDALHRRVTMRRDLASGLPRVIGDRSHVEQVLVILIVNAMDAMKDTPEGSRELLVSARDLDDGFVEIAVRDFGHGITAQTCRRFSIRCSRQSPRAWAWGCQSRALSSPPIKDASGPKTRPAAARCFVSRCDRSPRQPDPRRVESRCRVGLRSDVRAGGLDLKIRLYGGRHETEHHTRERHLRGNGRAIVWTNYAGTFVVDGGFGGNRRVPCKRAGREHASQG